MALSVKMNTHLTGRPTQSVLCMSAYYTNSTCLFVHVYIYRGSELNKDSSIYILVPRTTYIHMYMAFLSQQSLLPAVVWFNLAHLSICQRLVLLVQQDEAGQRSYPGVFQLHLHCTACLSQAVFVTGIHHNHLGRKEKRHEWREGNEECHSWIVTPV